jgi:hypothetical protein
MNRFIGACGLSLTATMVVHAQTTPRPRFSNPYPTCHGTTVGLAMGAGGTLSVVRGLDPLSPEALAGLRTGDTIVTMNGFVLGHPLPAGTTTTWRYTPGDTNVYEVRGTTGARRVTFVVGEWHAVPADSTAIGLEGSPTRRLCRPRAAAR